MKTRHRPLRYVLDVNAERARRAFYVCPENGGWGLNLVFNAPWCGPVAVALRPAPRFFRRGARVRRSLPA